MSISGAATSAEDTQQHSTGYRSDITGLRAMAILAVMVYHGLPGYLPGGFVGVDIFFVISGFLISDIILRSLDLGNFTIRRFYERRIRRILPAFVVVQLAVLTVGWTFLYPSEWQNLSKHVFATSIFADNIALIREQVRYFDSVKPLLHLWSLSIEEQFYLVWPVLLVLCSRSRHDIRITVVALVTVGAFAANLLISQSSPSADFFSSISRFWELSVGALIALTFRNGPPTTGFQLGFEARLQGVISAAGIVMLALAFGFISENRVFPGYPALLPTAGAACIILAGPNAWFNRVVLASRPAVFFGLISYPLYLWHWPVLVFTRLLNHSLLSPLLGACALISSIGLAWVTFALVERPLRYHPSRSVPIMLLTCLAGVAGLGLAGYWVWGPRLRLARGAQLASAAAVDWSYPFESNMQRTSDFRTGKVGFSEREQVLVVGDSHAAQYYPRIKALANASGSTLPITRFATYPGCPPLPATKMEAPGSPDCDKFFQFVDDLVMTDKQLKTVVLASYWEMYFGYQSGGNRLSLVMRTNQTVENQPSLEVARGAFQDLGARILAWTGAGKRVYVILSNPSARGFSPEYMVSRVTGAFHAFDVPRESLAQAGTIDAVLKASVTASGARTIDPVEALCSPSSCPPTMPDGSPIFLDAHHLRASWVQEHATFIDQIYTDP